MPTEGRAQTAGSLGRTGDKLDATLGHKSVLDKQKSAIEKLRAQNEELKHELLLENKFSLRPGDAFSQSLINSLQDEGDNLARKIVLEVRKTKMLDQQMGFCTDQLSTTRNLMGGIYTAKEQSINVQKRIKLLENRLERAYVKFNQSITHNKQLREQINNLRRERIMFESIHSNLERELTKVKKDMAETIQLANQIFEAKEKAIAEMGQLMAQAEKEQADFEKQWRELTQELETDKRDRERARAHELAVRERETQELLKSGMSDTQRRGSSATKRGTMGSPAFNKALAQNVAAEKVQMYGQAFEKIQQATGIEDIDQLVNSFISAEGQNYTLFNYVNEVNNEIEKLEDQTGVIKAEIERYKDSGQELDRSKGSAMRDVEDRLGATEAKAELYEKRFEAASETVAHLKSSIWDLFNKIGCNTQAVRELLGEEGQISEGNILAHLGIIEQRTNEILQAYMVYRSKDRSKASQHWPPHNVIAQALLAQPLTSASPRIIIDPPSSTGPTPEEVEMLLQAEQAAMESSGTGPVDMASLGAGAGILGPEDDKPLSRDALISRVSKTMPRKLETAIKVRPPGAADHSAHRLFGDELPCVSKTMPRKLETAILMRTRGAANYKHASPLRG